MSTLRDLFRSHPVICRLALAALLMVALHAVAGACPNCGLDVVEEQKGGAGLKDGFTYSIIGLAGMPFLILAVVGGFIVRAYRGHASAIASGDGGDEP